MTFRLFSFIFIYLFILCLLYFPQQEYVHSHCQSTIISLDEISISCIACSDLIHGKQQTKVKNGILKVYQPKSSNQNENDIKIKVYQQMQCYEYECSQLGFKEGQKTESMNQLNKFGFVQTNNNQQPTFSECAKDIWSFFNFQPTNQNEKCSELSKPFSNIKKNETVYSLMFRITYALKTNSFKNKLIESEKTDSQKLKQTEKFITQFQPPSFYLVYSQFGLQNALLFVLIAAITISQSDLFFAQVFHEKYRFLGSSKRIAYIILGLNMAHYGLFWDNSIITGLLNSIWVFMLMKVILDSQKANQLCSRIFSLFLSLLWGWISISGWEYGRGVMLGYGIMLTLMQYCFIFTINSSTKTKILLIICLVILTGSIYLHHKSQFIETAYFVVINLPFLQFMLLISSYELEKNAQNQRIFPPHSDVEDIQLKISRELGY